MALFLNQLRTAIMKRALKLNFNLLISFTCFAYIGLFCASVDGQSTCTTPDNENGFCIPAQRCDKRYFEQLQTRPQDELVEFLKDSRCNSDANIHLCCNRFFVRPISWIGSDAYVSSLNEAGLKVLDGIESCGSDPTERVAYGQEAKLGQYPWMALLEYDVPDVNPYLCAGSLITNRYVLTAAHCMVGVNTIKAVILGEHNLDTDPDCQRRGKKTKCAPPRERYGVEKLIPHSDYRKRYIGFDIALILLDRDVTFSRFIKPICLPVTPLSVIQQSRFIIAGWGTTETESTSKVLQTALVEYQERRICEETYRRQRITSHHLCIGGNGPVDTCKGDSGGPLFVPSLYLPSKPRWIQYGIVSFGTRSCSALEKYPGVYTNVTEFMPWITNNIID